MQPLKGKNALITGGSRGIGAASAFHLATAGANIAITYSSSSDDALKVVRQLEDLGVKAKAYHADAAHKESLHKSMADIISDFGDVHILVNNAGTFVGGTIGEIDEPEYQRVMAILGGTLPELGSRFGTKEHSGQCRATGSNRYRHEPC